jgi:orotidine-5'-phosphate decarboxylase
MTGERGTATATTALERLEARWRQGRFLCVGLDPDLAKLPPSLARNADPAKAIVAFNSAIVAATHEFVCAYKPNAAYYEALGAAGWDALAGTIAAIKAAHPDIPVILDAKRGDIGPTNAGYARQIFDLLGADMATVHPYFGQEALAPFLERRDRGIIVMASNSNPGAGEFQDEIVASSGEPLYLHVARAVAERWNAHGNCLVTVGATFPEKMRRVREAVGDLPFLVLGVGAQGGALAGTIRHGADSRGLGLIISSSRAIIYASAGDDFAAAAGREAERFHEAIAAARGGA